MGNFLLLLYRFSHRGTEKKISKLLKALMFQVVFRAYVFMCFSESTELQLIIELLRKIIITYNSKLLLGDSQNKKGYKLLDNCFLKLNFKGELSFCSEIQRARKIIILKLYNNKKGK